MANPVPRPAQNHQATRDLPYDHAAISATTSVKLWSTKDRPHKVQRVFYNNPTGFAQDPSAYWTVSITDGTTTLASWSTQTGTNGTLTADTPVDLVLVASTGLAASKNLVVTFTKTGAPANLPAGRLVTSHTPF